MNESAQINQLLSTGSMNAVYHYGAFLAATDAGNHLTFVDGDNTIDYSQPFVASGTSMSRIKLPLQANGNGADVLISLYPDNGSGSPNTSSAPLAATRLTAAYLDQVSAPNGLENATSPLQTTQNATYFCTGGVNVNSTWSGGGNFVGNSYAYDNGWAIWTGGSATGTTNFTLVNTSQYVGGTAPMSPPINQPALTYSSNSGALAVVGTVLVQTGGLSTQATNTAQTTVNAASWNSATGVIGSWSLQQPLPVALWDHGTAGNAATSSVYVVGGLLSGGTTPQTSVYWASVQSSGQLTQWNTATPLPTGLALPFVACIAGWLVVCGGQLSIGSNTGSGFMYYAKINSDGSLSSWQNGSSMVYGMTPLSQGQNQCTLSNALCLMGGSDGSGTSSNKMQVLTVTAADGPATAWTAAVLDFTYESAWIPVSLGTGGQWAAVALFPGTGGIQGITRATTLQPVPFIQVPLTTSSMTNGNKYHIVIQQNQTYSESDFVQVGTIESIGGTSLTALSSTRHSGTWTALASGNNIPIYYYGTSQTFGISPELWYITQDVDPVTNVTGRWTALLYTNNGLVQGALESTELPNLALNVNPTFTTNVANWTPTNGTFTQSSAQTHGGFPFSGLLTPTGGFSQAYVQSNSFNIYPGSKPTVNNLVPWINGQGWFFSSTGWASFMININWFDNTGTYISTSGGPVTNLPANTWTFSQSFVQPPLGATTATIVPTEFGTPGATNLLYCSNVFAMYSPEYGTALTSAAQVVYGSVAWPPTGVTQLL